MRRALRLCSCLHADIDLRRMRSSLATTRARTNAMLRRALAPALAPTLTLRTFVRPGMTRLARVSLALMRGACRATGRFRSRLCGPLGSAARPIGSDHLCRGRLLSGSAALSSTSLLLCGHGISLVEVVVKTTGLLSEGPSDPCAVVLFTSSRKPLSAFADSTLFVMASQKRLKFTVTFVVSANRKRIDHSRLPFPHGGPDTLRTDKHLRPLGSTTTRRCRGNRAVPMSGDGIEVIHSPRYKCTTIGQDRQTRVLPFTN